MSLVLRNCELRRCKATQISPPISASFDEWGWRDAESAAGLRTGVERRTFGGHGLERQTPAIIGARQHGHWLERG